MEISRRTVITSLAAAFVLPMTGCAAQIRSESSPESSSPPPSTPPAAATVPVTIGVPARPQSLDPSLTVDAESHRSTRQVLETLLGVDHNTGAPIPHLASDWTVSDDGLRYTFSLTPDVEFHDGTALTADVVAANFERWARLPDLLGQDRLDRLPRLAFASVFGGYAGDEQCRYVECQTVGERTVSLVLSAPIVFLAAALTSPPFALSSPDSWVEFDRALADTEPGDLPEARPSGTGPFLWGAAPSGGTGEHLLVLEADPDYRGGPSAVGPVTLSMITGVQQRLRELRRGRLDAFDYVSPSTLRPLVQGGAQVLQRDPFSVLYLGMNTQHPILGQLYVRQAVAHALDRRALAEEYFLAGSSRADEFVPPSLGVAHPELTTYGYDAEKARELLELAGYRGEPLEFLYPVETSRPYLPSPEPVYARIAEDLAHVGFVLEPVPVRWEDGYLDRLTADTGRAFHLSGRTGEYRDPHPFLEPLFGSHSTEFGYSNPFVVETLAAAVSTRDAETRTRLYRRGAESLALDLPALPLVYPISAVASGHTLVSYPTSPVLDERFDRIVPVDQTGPRR
ncbi:ABC transporter substrate-binding protein [Citricoccus sp.]|uniref:ABC transporter substrate-binding protein n=1 Tax=Citricoccus sp. TaxID=1978372 RepID=UPI0028BE9F08|nr:ABC transporter substrate-binding protein [Citricoccus sp.]